MTLDEWLTVLVAVAGGAIRVSTPFLFVSLGECITEKSGRINLGLEGTMVFGAMFGYAVSYHSGSAWCLPRYMQPHSRAGPNSLR